MATSGETGDVLLVEDDKVLSGVVRRFIELAGYTARCAADGKSALQAMEERLPGIVLLDLMLPDMSGFEICQKLKSDEKTRQIPVVMVTALADAESRQRGMECGATEYLTKPFNPDELIEAIKRNLPA